MFKVARKSLFFLFFLVSNFTHGLAYQKTTTMIPMRDGIRLATDIYLPSVRKNPIPCILVRTPYGKSHALDEWLMFILVDLLQYAITIQDMRGRYASEGIDSLYFSDGWGRIRDGYDTIEWLAQQSWCNGKIGMFGASAMGITQYLAAGANPPHLRCCVVMVAASNLYEDAIFYGGEYQKALVNGWLKDVGGEDLISFFFTYHDYSPVYDPVNLSTRRDSVNVPILHIGGWYDIFTQSILNAFMGIQDKGGPWPKGNKNSSWGHGCTIFQELHVENWFSQIAILWNSWMKLSPGWRSISKAFLQKSLYPLSNTISWAILKWKTAQAIDGLKVLLGLPRQLQFPCI